MGYLCFGVWDYLLVRGDERESCCLCVGRVVSCVRSTPRLRACVGSGQVVGAGCGVWDRGLEQ